MDENKRIENIKLNEYIEIYYKIYLHKHLNKL